MARVLHFKYVRGQKAGLTLDYMLETIEEEEINVVDTGSESSQTPPVALEVEVATTDEETNDGFVMPPELQVIPGPSHEGARGAEGGARGAEGSARGAEDEGQGAEDTRKKIPKRKRRGRKRVKEIAPKRPRSTCHPSKRRKVIPRDVKDQACLMRENGFTVQEVADSLKVSTSSVHDWARHGRGMGRVGRNKLLTEKEEQMIEDFALLRQYCSRPMTRLEFRIEVSEILRHSERYKLLKKGMPGENQFFIFVTLFSTVQNIRNIRKIRKICPL